MSAVLGADRPATPAAIAPAATASGSALLALKPADAVPLGALLRRAGAAVRDGIPDAVWVLAAVTSVKPARGGHAVELVEPDRPRAEAGMLRTYLPEAVVEALRRSAGRAIAAVDLVGMTVVVRVAVELHPRWGLSGRILSFGPGIEASLARLALEASVARLRREGLLDRQRGLPVPRDVTRVAVVHPPAAAGWADIAAELSRWEAAGLIAVRSLPTPFEGFGATTGIAAAVGRAAGPVEGHAPDVVLLVRGGGAAVSLGALDDEPLARAVAGLAVPVICGLGHASDGRTLADRIAWLSADTPSKAMALVRAMMTGPARQARADHRAVLAATAAGVDHAGPRLAALERLATAAALRRTVAATQDLDRRWAAVREFAEGTRGRLARLGDGLDRVAADAVAAAPLVVGRSSSELAAIMEAVRARARRAGAGVDDGARHLALATHRAASRVEATAAGLAALDRSARAAALIAIDRGAAELDALARAVHARAREAVTRADDGARPLDGIETAVAAMHRVQDAAITRLRDAVDAAAGRSVDGAEAALDRALGALDGADPRHVLRRGFALVTDGLGRPVTSAAAARAAAALTLAFADGTVAVTLTPSSIIGDPT